MTDPEELRNERALARMGKSMFAIGAGGAIALFAWKGWTWGGGFALGALASWGNFALLKNVVDALGSKRPTRKRVAVLAGLRYLILGAGAYVILRFSSISVSATLMGLFVAVAAVILEILLQLVYARN
jgi:hypothetical protein